MSDKIVDDMLNRLHSKFKESYKGILPDDVIEQSFQWYEEFLRKELTLILEVERLRAKAEGLKMGLYVPFPHNHLNEEYDRITAAIKRLEGENE